MNNNEVVVRKAEITDLKYIQRLNKELFDLEFKNYDSTLKPEWPISDEGEEYFKDAIENSIVIVATIDNKVIG